MKQRSDIEKNVDQILNSFDGMERATPQPWLFLRVKKRLLQLEEKTIWKTTGSFLSRPAVTIAGLCVILILNGILVLNQQKETSAATLQNEQQPVDSESLIAVGSSFDYESLVQP